MYERRRLMLCGKKIISPLYIYEPGYKKFKNVLRTTYSGNSLPTLTYYGTHVVVKCNDSSISSTGRQSLLLKVDFTHYNKLSIRYQITGTSSGPYLGYSLNGKDFVEKVSGLAFDETAEFNIRSCNGEYYVKLQPDSNYHLVVYEIKLEV